MTLIVGATTVLTELQHDLDIIWRAPPRKSSGVIAALCSRLLSFCLVVCIGFLFLASLVVSTALSALAAHGVAVCRDRRWCSRRRTSLPGASC